MALIACWECKSEISDSAPACPRCGAQRAPAAPTAVYSVPQPGKKAVWPWVIGVPAALFALFLLYGLSIPEYKAQAMAQRRACEQLMGGMRNAQCDSIYDSQIAAGQAAAAPPRRAASVPGVTQEMIDAALLDGSRKAAENWKPTENPRPPPGFFTGK